MQACPGDDTITLLVCGQLVGAQVTELQSHVVDCASCRKLVGLLETALPEGSGNERLRASMLGLLAPGTVVGRYRIEDALGAGGMGVVYAAHDPELDRKVALKLLYPMIEADGQDELALRLRHESTTMARLRHPNVATIHDIGRHHDQLFLVMELVQGTTLRVWVGANKPWQTVDRDIRRGRQGARRRARCRNHPLRLQARQRAARCRRSSTDHRLRARASRRRRKPAPARPSDALGKPGHRTRIVVDRRCRRCTRVRDAGVHGAGAVRRVDRGGHPGRRVRVLCRRCTKSSTVDGRSKVRRSTSCASRSREVSRRSPPRPRRCQHGCIARSRAA